LGIVEAWKARILNHMSLFVQLRKTFISPNVRVSSRILRVLLLFLFACPLPSRSEESCKSLLLAQTPISYAALDALREARGSFEIEVLSKVIDGRPRAIILAGESHVKREKASLAGASLTGQFPFRGLEGADISKNGLAGKLFSPVLASMDLIAKKILRLKGSSIDDAWVRSGVEIAKNEVAMEVASRMKAERGMTSMRLTAAEEQDLLTGLQEIDLETGDHKRRIRVKGEDVLPLIKLHLADPASPWERRKPLNLTLEDGHQPGLRENLAMVEFPLTLGLIGSDLTLSFASSHWHPEWTESSQALSAFTTLVSLYSLSKFALQKKHSEKRWFHFVFPLHRGLLEGRNETMVANIDRGFLENPDYDQMLVFVGQAHVKGMKNLLLEHYGYREAIIPELPSN
jgi:hypothetical protein